MGLGRRRRHVAAPVSPSWPSRARSTSRSCAPRRSPLPASAVHLPSWPTPAQLPSVIELGDGPGARRVGAVLRRSRGGTCRRPGRAGPRRHERRRLHRRRRAAARTWPALLRRPGPSRTAPPTRSCVVVLDDEPVRRAGHRRRGRPAARRPPAAPLPIGAARNLGATPARRPTGSVMLDVDCIPRRDLVARYATVLRRPPAARSPAARCATSAGSGTTPASTRSTRGSCDARSAAPVGRPLPPHGEAWHRRRPPRPVLVAQLRRRPPAVGPARRLRRALRRLRRRGHRPRLAGARDLGVPAGLVRRGRRLPPVAPAGATTTAARVRRAGRQRPALPRTVGRGGRWPGG